MLFHFPETFVHGPRDQSRGVPLNLSMYSLAVGNPSRLPLDFARPRGQRVSVAASERSLGNDVSGFGRGNLSFLACSCLVVFRSRGYRPVSGGGVARGRTVLTSRLAQTGTGPRDVAFSAVSRGQTEST
jgi:hypothetical protein